MYKVRYGIKKMVIYHNYRDRKEGRTETLDGTKKEYSKNIYYSKTCQNTCKNASRSTQENKKYERCVCCHRTVSILKDEVIDFRPFYIEGAGQLCYDCFHELYRSDFGTRKNMKK